MKLFILLLLFNSNAIADSIIKDGTCPSGYHQSGSYCVGINVPPAIKKRGACPSGYHQSGSYCLGNSISSGDVIEKTGNCPSGYHQSGSYCKKSRRE